MENGNSTWLIAWYVNCYVDTINEYIIWSGKTHVWSLYYMYWIWQRWHAFCFAQTEAKAISDVWHHWWQSQCQEPCSWALCWCPRSCRCQPLNSLVGKFDVVSDGLLRHLEVLNVGSPRCKSGLDLSRLPFISFSRPPRGIIKLCSNQEKSIDWPSSCVDSLSIGDMSPTNQPRQVLPTRCTVNGSTVLILACKSAFICLRQLLQWD